MPDTKHDLFLYEGLELRAEYDARIKALKSLLPESRGRRDRFAFGDDDARTRPVAAFRVDDTRDGLAALEFKRRKLNAAIEPPVLDYGRTHTALEEDED